MIQIGGMYRVTSGAPLATWGDVTGIFTQTTQTVNTTSSGKNVDTVVVDAHINFNHPEFAVNVDGTGGSRAVQYDWFQHSTALGYSTSGPYSYSDISSNHGTHVAGTVAGNTQGWARDASVYNMEFNMQVVMDLREIGHYISLIIFDSFIKPKR